MVREKENREKVSTKRSERREVHALPFIGRNEEIGLIRDTINDLSAGDDKIRVLSFYGIPGSGATSLALRCKDLWYNEWSFEKDSWSLCYIGQEDIKGGDLSLDAKTRLGRTDFLQGRKTVVWLDIPHNLQSPLLEPIQKEVVTPLFKTGKSLVVITGGTVPMRLKDVRERRIERHPLLPFTSEETARQLGIPQETAGSVCQFTGGHPGANRYLKTLIKKHGWLTVGALTAHKEEVAEQLMDNYVVPEILCSHLAGEQGERQEMSEPVKTLAVLGLLPDGFEINMLGGVLTAAMPDIYKEYMGQDFLWLLGKLMNTSFVGWESSLIPYVVKPAALRVMLANYTTYVLPEIAKCTHKAAAEVLTDWLRTPRVYEKKGPEEIVRLKEHFAASLAFHRTSANLI